MDQTNGETRLEIGGFPPSFLSLAAASRRWMEDPNKPCKPYITVARSNFKEKRSSEQQIEESWEVSIRFLSQLFSSPPHTHVVIGFRPTNTPDGSYWACMQLHKGTEG